jgi:hypothetical protein
VHPGNGARARARRPGGKTCDLLCGMRGSQARKMTSQPRKSRVSAGDQWRPARTGVVGRWGTSLGSCGKRSCRDSRSDTRVASFCDCWTEAENPKMGNDGWLGVGRKKFRNRPVQRRLVTPAHPQKGGIFPCGLAKTGLLISRRGDHRDRRWGGGRRTRWPKTLRRADAGVRVSAPAAGTGRSRAVADAQRPLPSWKVGGHARVTPCAISRRFTGEPGCGESRWPLVPKGRHSERGKPWLRTFGGKAKLGPNTLTIPQTELLTRKGNRPLRRARDGSLDLTTGRSQRSSLGDLRKRWLTPAQGLRRPTRCRASHGYRPVRAEGQRSSGSPHEGRPEDTLGWPRARSHGNPPENPATAGSLAADPEARALGEGEMLVLDPPGENPKRGPKSGDFVNGVTST